jgi:serine/tyrosine/threonine adenylyltransferase
MSGHRALIAHLETERAQIRSLGTRCSGGGWQAVVVSVEAVTVEAPSALRLEGSDFWDLRGLYEPWPPAPVPAPRLVVLNESLATELGLDATTLSGPQGVALFAGNALPDGPPTVAQAYAGHQFGGYSPRLGDGRALLLGELVDVDGRRRDVQLKGSGPTPFARGGDGRAALGPMLREYVIGEAMHALGIPTTRALAVVSTGERVARDTLLPGAVLTRVAASHLRVGTFQFAAGHPDPSLLASLADHAIARHYPHLRDAEQPYVAFYDAVVDAQASLIARWMLVGFIHGVMNTDNMTISGETIDYGPCAFMDTFDPATVFSSIDYGGRYAYGNQPQIAMWNLARLAEAILPLLHAETEPAVEAATAVLQTFADRYQRYWADGMRAKLGLTDRQSDDGALIDDLLQLLQLQRVDFTSFFRALSRSIVGEQTPARLLFAEPAGFDTWSARWRARLSPDHQPTAIATAMDQINPVYVPRNHEVEAALAAATDGDLSPFRQLVDVLARPFDERPGLETYAMPAPPSFGPYRTFCGT